MPAVPQHDRPAKPKEQLAAEARARGRLLEQARSRLPRSSGSSAVVAPNALSASVTHPRGPGSTSQADRRARRPALRGPRVTVPPDVAALVRAGHLEEVEPGVFRRPWLPPRRAVRPAPTSPSPGTGASGAGGAPGALWGTRRGIRVTRTAEVTTGRLPCRWCQAAGTVVRDGVALCRPCAAVVAELAEHARRSGSGNAPHTSSPGTHEVGT